MAQIDKRMHVRFAGRVQGVGFRYTVAALSSSFNVTGYVRNDFDGSVEMIVEGAEDASLHFLDAILQSGLKRYIVQHTVAWFSAKNEFSSFGIKY